MIRAGAGRLLDTGVGGLDRGPRRIAAPARQLSAGSLRRRVPPSRPREPARASSPSGAAADQIRSLSSCHCLNLRAMTQHTDRGIHAGVKLSVSASAILISFRLPETKHWKPHVTSPESHRGRHPCRLRHRRAIANWYAARARGSWVLDINEKASAERRARKFRRRRKADSFCSRTGSTIASRGETRRRQWSASFDPGQHIGSLPPQRQALCGQPAVINDWETYSAINLTVVFNVRSRGYANSMRARQLRMAISAIHRSLLPRVCAGHRLRNRRLRLHQARAAEPAARRSGASTPSASVFIDTPLTRNVRAANQAL